MTPAARVQAAIEILDRVLAGQAAEHALTAWARGARYAGSGDRAAVRDHVFDALRCLRSYAALAGAEAPSGRAVMIGALGGACEALFTGAPHAPAALTEAERSARDSAPAVDALPEAVRLDLPDWLVPQLNAALGADFAAAMLASRDRAPVFLRVNSAKATPEAALAALAADGIGAERASSVECALRVLENANKIKNSQAYLQGLVELQDLSSQAAVELLPLKAGVKVLDYCAGGGGKSLAMAARAPVVVSAHDAARQRMADLPARAARAGARIRLADRRDLQAAGYDLVLVDAPCSGSGTWRRTPDAKWRLTPERLAELTALQARILDEALAYVRPGGVLAYMTCSYLAAENEAQVRALLARRSGLSLTLERRFSVLTGGDGFFIALLSHA